MDASEALRLGNYQADTWESQGATWFACPLPIWRAMAGEIEKLRSARDVDCKKPEIR